MLFRAPAVELAGAFLSGRKYLPRIATFVFDPRMIRRLHILLFLFFGLAAAHAQELRATHPLDALTPAEIQTVVETLRAAGHADEKTVYPVMELHEPLKKDVLKWKLGEPFIRAAHIVTRRTVRPFWWRGRVFEKRNVVLCMAGSLR